MINLNNFYINLGIQNYKSKFQTLLLFSDRIETLKLVKYKGCTAVQLEAQLLCSKKGLNTSLGFFLHGVCKFSQCTHGFPPGTAASNSLF